MLMRVSIEVMAGRRLGLAGTVALVIGSMGSCSSDAETSGVRGGDSSVVSTTSGPSSTRSAEEPTAPATGPTATTAPTGEAASTTVGGSDPPTTEPTSSTVSSADDFVVDLPGYASYSGPYGPGAADQRLAGDRQVGGGCVWFERDDGSRISVLWPDGWQARFFATDTGLPTFEVLDETGAVVGREGNVISAAGSDTDEADHDRRCVVPRHSGSPLDDVTGPRVIEVLDIFTADD